MEDMKKKAKRAALEHMKKKMSKAMGSRLGGPGAMKATVVAKDEEGLEEGLKKAHELMADKESPLHEAMEEAKEDKDLSAKELMELLKKKLGK